VNHLTSIQAVYFAPKHVTVNAIMPGVFPSKMTAYGLHKNADKIVNSQPTGEVIPSTLFPVEAVT
jgi:NAD(P)-dependent dehydrogenase (short-subunit alcohol dehydrogenase family)